MKQQAAQVYFPVTLYLEMKHIAKEEGLPMAAWVREIVEKEVRKKNSKKKSLIDLPVFDWAEGEPDLSERIDETLYDNP